MFENYILKIYYNKNMKIDQKIKKLERELNKKVGENKINRTLKDTGSIDVEEFLKKASELSDYIDGKNNHNFNC